MRKVFVAYKQTGEDPEQLRVLLTAVVEAWKSRGFDVHCTLFDQERFKAEGMTAKMIMAQAISTINRCEFLFVVQTSNEKSEGMLMEVGYCFGTHMPIIVGTKLGVENTYVPQLAFSTFDWANVEDLVLNIQHARLPAPI